VSLEAGVLQAASIKNDAMQANKFFKLDMAAILDGKFIGMYCVKQTHLPSKTNFTVMFQLWRVAGPFLASHSYTATVK